MRILITGKSKLSRYLGDAFIARTGHPVLLTHCRFEDEEGKWIDFTPEFPTNHFGTYKKHGKWVKPVFPSNISCQGSPATPYIFDDRCDFRDVAKAIKYWYDMGRDKRKEHGKAGHDWVCSEESGMSAREMSTGFIKNMETCFEKWEPRKRFKLYKVEQVPINETPGVLV